VTIVIALLAGVGVVLAVSPLLWPRGEAPVGLPRAGQPTLVSKMAGRSVLALRTQLVAVGLRRVSVLSFVAASVLISLVVAAVTFALLPVVSLAFAVGVAMLAVPTLLVRKRANNARRLTRALWPDLVDHLVSAVRSGLSLPDSLSVLAHTGPEAVREAFALFDTRYRVTGDFDHCIDELKDALLDPVADRILETLRMSREVGGSELTMVLRSLAAYLRQDAAIRSEVEARQSWVMNSARLGVAAPWVVLALLSTRPEAVVAYNTTLGAVVVIVGLGLSVVAYQVMVGLGHIPPERRWFR
jgi:tight adherence protein B